MASNNEYEQQRFWNNDSWIKQQEEKFLKQFSELKIKHSLDLILNRLAKKEDLSNFYLITNNENTFKKL